MRTQTTTSLWFDYAMVYLLSHRQILGTGNLPQDDDDDFCYKRVQTPGMSPPRAGAWTYYLFTPFPKTLPRFVLILTESQRNQAFCVTAADWSHDHDLININLIVYLMFNLPQFRNSWTDFYRRHMVEKQRFLAFH